MSTAIWGLPGYTFLGIHKEARKLFGSSVVNYVISARTAQGYEEFQASTAQERLTIISRWNALQAENSKSSQKDSPTPTDGRRSRNSSPKGFLSTRHLSFDERKKLYEERKARREAERNKIQCQDGRPSCPFCRRANPHAHTPLVVDTPVVVSEPQSSDTDSEFERAIQASIAATSCGNPDQDAMIERAIRASVRELQNDAETTASNQEAINRAIQASISEAWQEPGQRQSTTDSPDYQSSLERSIRDSLASYKLQSRSKIGREGNKSKDVANPRPAQPSIENQPDDINSDDDEDMKLAIQRSKSEHEQSNAEEEIVMQYMKKQSLAEEALRLKSLENQRSQSRTLQNLPTQSTMEEENAADEEALQLAIKASLESANSDSPPGSGEDSHSVEGSARPK